MESAASGIIAGINAARVALGEEPVVPPKETIIGALLDYVANCPIKDFQPMNSNFGILPELTGEAPQARSEGAQDRAGEEGDGGVCGGARLELEQRALEKETLLPLIGINQDTFHIEAGGFPSFEEMICGIAELGLNLFEFCPEYIEQTPDALTPERRRAAMALAQSLGVKLLVHASFASVNICFINEHTRAESVRQLKREIQLAHDLESDAITIHPGPPTGHARWYAKDMAWSMMLKSYEELLAFAEPLGVCICTENMPRFVSREDDLTRLLANVDCPGFGLTFDFGHHNLIYNDLPLPDRTAKMKDILCRFHDRIRVLHLHDNKGTKDDHEGLGWGEIDYNAAVPEVLRLGINAYWSMELAGREAVAQSKAKLSEYLI